MREVQRLFGVVLILDGFIKILLYSLSTTQQDSKEIIEQESAAFAS